MLFPLLSFTDLISASDSFILILPLLNSFSILPFWSFQMIAAVLSDRPSCLKIVVLASCLSSN